MIGDVFSYARTRLKAQGLTEWTGGFTFENIPKTKLDSVFHLDMGQARGAGNNQLTQTIEVPFTVRVFCSPAKDSRARIDDGIKRGDSVIADFIAAKNRFNQPGIKNISFDAMEIVNISKSNDNGVIVKIDFSALVLESTG